MAPTAEPRHGAPWYLLVNTGVYLAAAVIGAVFSSAVSYLFTDYGTVPGSALGAIAGGALFLLAHLVALGLPIAITAAALTGWLTARRQVSRAAVMAIALIAGVVWLALWPSLTPTDPAVLSLLTPWLLFGLFMRRPRDIRER